MANFICLGAAVVFILSSPVVPLLGSPFQENKSQVLIMAARRFGRRMSRMEQLEGEIEDTCNLALLLQIRISEAEARNCSIER